ncbi:MAG TPA: hypothetical protein VD884_03565 [Ohtaekwangia sp.]|nr:hypothetical protein [Ohtaekwangia sp.]
MGAPTPNFLWSVNYYDDKYRVIQNIALNQPEGRDIVTNVYDFVGKVMNTRTTHNAEAVLQQAMEKMAKYKQKYESLNSLSDIKNSPKSDAW